MITKLAYGAVIALAFAPVMSFAVSELPNPQLNLDRVLSIIGTIANWIFAIFLAVAVIYILYAAYLYLKGEEAGIEDAKKRLIAAAIAIAIALLARGVEPLVRSILGPGGGGVIPG
ncbi:MAG: hypothetical protein HYT82_00740 [Candidatus Harrisonbacteria bacterium]|nr:hypothetical protein [Candidatus Harrisonbacteria bacterium]MBI2604038.1 hypothetical protein [Candidatus Harrisonbacteria bacterium]